MATHGEADGRRYPVICGPTAGGKSRLAVELAQALVAAGRPTEIVSADSMQVYRAMDIGTAKPDADERRGIEHHLIDVVEPTERFSVADWLGRARPLIDALRDRGIVPVVVGGTHLYVQALLDGLMDGPEPDERLRATLRAMAPGERRTELERVDPAAAARIHPNDERRTVRALEVFRQTGVPISEHQKQWGAGTGAGVEAGQGGDAVLIGLDWTSEGLNRRINARVRGMVADGLEGEVRALWEAGRLGPQAGEGLGYKQFVASFEGRCTRDEAVERIKIETRRFAKNQRTWLKRLRQRPGSRWLQPERDDDLVAAAGSVLSG
ncbi:MAG: tRNA (adenosine(37)-N6)-dimethylallyltransferase MiaA [Planctomycetota bacterium]